MLTPWDDFPIHPGAEPIVHPSTGDPNHYDRYWFNGHAKDGSFYLGAAMGHYPARGVVDAAFALVKDGVEHSVFASGLMPLDRATKVGPIRIEVIEPMRTIRYVVEANDLGWEVDLTFRAKTIAVEEPRQVRYTPEGVFIMDHTRLTQWGAWEGTISIDGDELQVDPSLVPGTRDRSWGMRPVGKQVETNRERGVPHVFWMWAPLHFDDLCTHFAMHEYANGHRWLETAQLVPLLEPGQETWGHDPTTELGNLRYEFEYRPGTRDASKAVLLAANLETGDEFRMELETLYTFRMRGIGYTHPHWGHGSNHGVLETGRESIKLDEFDTKDPSCLHIQNVVKARLIDSSGTRDGIGVLEQFTLGEHPPAGLTGLLDPGA